MAIGRISGAMLYNNLERQGIDLAIEGNLLYVDVTNRRLGVNNSAPNYDIDAIGNVRLARLTILGDTITSNTGKIGLGSISNVVIYGGSPNYVLQTDGAGNLSFIDANASPAIEAFSANLGAYQIYANANIGSIYNHLNTLDANVGNYENTTNANIGTLYLGNISTNANLGMLYLGNISTNANLGTLYLGNISTNANLGAYQIYANANIGSIYNHLNTLDANVGNYENTTNANIGTLYLGNISTNANLGILYLGNISTSANLGAYQIWANANAASQATSIDTINANIGAFETYANLYIGAAAYGNANVAAYLPTYTGNITAGNILTTNEYTTYIHTNYISGNTGNVVSFTGTGALQLPVGSSGNRPVGVNGYVRFNTDLPSLEYFDGTIWVPITNTVTDQQITPDGTSDTYTLTQSATTVGTMVSINGVLQTPGVAYTIADTSITFTEIPLATDIIDVRFLGAAVTINSTLADDLIISGNLTVNGNIVNTNNIYTYGNTQVAAYLLENPQGGTTYSNANVKSYLTHFDGNIIPSANVTYSLGDSTHQWKDLWVSNNTIYIGNTPITVSGGTLLVNSSPIIGGTTYSNTNVSAYLSSQNITSANIGGDLSVSGNITGTAVNITAPTFHAVTPSWGITDSAASAWFLLGTWNTVQAGNSLYMRLLAHCGYNAVANQNQVTELMFVTANGSSYIAGSSGNFYAAGSASVNSRLGTGGNPTTYQAPNKFRIVQVSVTQYQVYAYFGAAYMRNSNYSIQITPGDTWTDGGGNTVNTPGGNYIEITPSAF
jgi:hypothetical protein